MVKERLKYIAYGAIPAAASALAVCPVFADDTGSANTAVTTAMQGVANDMVATMNSIIPIALTVVGLSMVIIAGIRIFKKIAGRG